MKTFLRFFSVLFFSFSIFLLLPVIGCGDVAGSSSPVYGPQDAGVNNSIPQLHNLSDSSDQKVMELMRKAIDGLGFSSKTGPSDDDLFLVSKHLMVWVDQTGFAGKPNGIWRMNGRAGDGLDFVLKEENGRPVNFLIVGENGDGRWPAGYMGGEHTEFPGKDGQYGPNEAATFTDPDISWWRSCNDISPPWDEKFNPIAFEKTASGLKLVYEVPIVKIANYKGRDCGGDYLFPDGVRRKVYLRIGLEFYRDQPIFDRTYQVRNPAENPPFDGPMSFIGGYVVTGWDNPHSLKNLLYWRPEHSDVFLNRDNEMLRGREWNYLGYLEPEKGDIILAWTNQPITFSAEAELLPGRSVTLQNIGPYDNEDVGGCLCYVHGGLELGGGLLHGGISLPINGGEMSIEARRRLILH